MQVACQKRSPYLSIGDMTAIEGNDHLLELACAVI